MGDKVHEADVRLTQERFLLQESGLTGEHDMVCNCLRNKICMATIFCTTGLKNLKVTFWDVTLICTVLFRHFNTAFSMRVRDYCIITNLFRQKFSSCIIHNCLREVILDLACGPQTSVHVRLGEVKNRFCLRRGEIDGTAVWCPLIRSVRLRDVSVSGGSTACVFIFVNP